MWKQSAALVLAACSTAIAQDAELPPPMITGWQIRYDGPDYVTQKQCIEMPPPVYAGPTSYTPVYHPGGTSGNAADHPGVKCHFARLVESGAPVGVMIKHCSMPFPEPGCTISSPDTLDLTIQAVRLAQGELHYVLMDIEGDAESFANPYYGVTKNLEAIVDKVRSHYDDRINGAYIGNYAMSATTYDAAQPFPTGSDVSYNAESYHSTGLNVSMPSCYPYSFYRGHAGVIDRNSDGPYGQRAPTMRAAYMWAPMERLSAAARALPEGHLLIPFVTRFIAWPNYPASDSTIPTVEDCKAFIVHARLRGAHGYYSFPSSYEAWGDNGFTVSDGGLTYDQYKMNILAAWGSLDADFLPAEASEILTLDNPKDSGLFVSGARFGDELVVAVSNLSGDEATVDLNEWLDLQLEGSGLHTVANETHEVLRFRIDPAIRDFDGDGTITRMDRGYGIREIRRAIRGERAAFDMGDVDGDGDIDTFDERRVMNAVRAYQKFDELDSMR